VLADGTMPETKQLLPSTNGCYDIPKNKDASIDIWFGPKKPDGVADPASIETIPAATSWWRYGSTDRASSSMTRPGSPTTS
jgi:hypothetical protein